MIDLGKEEEQSLICRIYLWQKGKVSARGGGFTRQLSTMVNAGLPINDALFRLKNR